MVASVEDKKGVCYPMVKVVVAYIEIQVCLMSRDYKE